MKQIMFDIKMVDTLIEFWRKAVKEADRKKDKESKLIASCYVDAFQTMRINHGFKCLK